jgi:DNA-binding response OmpR family regulator
MWTRLKILLVDDDELTLEMLGKMLATEDVEVFGFRDPRQASALIEEERFDGVFLDLNMPGVDGLALAKRIRNSVLNATTPIVVITGSDDSAAMKDAFSAGAHFFLAKPIDLTKVRRLVNATYGTLLREHSRNRGVALAVPLCCRAGSGSFRGTTSEISERSLHFRIKAILQPGELVHLGFSLPGSARAIEAMGAVVRSDDDGHTRCQLTKVDDGAQAALREFVALLPESRAARAAA